MAISASLFNGTTKGKIGEVVFFRVNGSQRARQYVGTINDRKSVAQLTQRVMLAPCVSAYRLLRSVLKDSFTNTPIEQSGYNAFVSANKTAHPSYFQKLEAASTTFSYAPYQISKGILAPLPVPESDGPALIYTLPSGTGDTLADFKRDFLAAYPDALPTDKFVYVRVYSPKGSLYPLPRIFTWSLSGLAFPVGVTYSAGELRVAIPDNTVPYSAACFRSQRDGNGKLNVSTQSLFNLQAAQTLYTTSFYNPEVLQLAIDSYGVVAQGIV